MVGRVVDFVHIHKNLLLQFENFVRIRRVQLLAHQYLIGNKFRHRKFIQ